MVARKVDCYGDTNDGKTELHLSEIALEDAIVQCDIKQTKTWGFQELYDYYKKHDMIISEQIASIDEERMQCSDNEMLNIKGFSLTFGDNSSESQFSPKSTEVEIKDLGTGNSFKVSIPTANSMRDLKFSVALTDIKLRVASKSNFFSRYVLCDVSMTPVVKLSSTKGADFEGEIPLIPTLPVTFLVHLSLDLSVEMHAEGSLTLEASTPLQFGGEVNSETGTRVIASSDSVKPELKIGASGEVGFSFGPKLSVGLFVPKNAFSISAPIGADLEVTNLTTRDKGERCLDFIDKHTRLSIKIAPAKVLDKVLEDKLGGSFSASLQVFGENPAPIFRSLSKRFYSESPIHAELIGGSLRLVDKCSFIGKPVESVSQEASGEASKPQISQEPNQSESELQESSKEVVEVTEIKDTYAVLVLEDGTRVASMERPVLLSELRKASLAVYCRDDVAGCFFMEMLGEGPEFYGIENAAYGDAVLIEDRFNDYESMLELCTAWDMKIRNQGELSPAFSWATDYNDLYYSGDVCELDGDGNRIADSIFFNWKIEKDE